MSTEIIVNEKTKIAPNSHKKDILALYGVPECLDKITEKEKSNLLNMLDCSAIAADSLNKISHSGGFFVEIPKGLREALRTGKATLDKAGRNIGSYTPNIRIKGESGIKGQITISKGCDIQMITQSVANLALMSMVQSVLEQLDVIEEKVDEINQGQKNDRIGSIIGPFKSFFDLYPTFQSKTELDIEVNATYRNMQTGLGKLHLQIDEERKKLSSAPSNGWKVFYNSLTHPFSSDLSKYKKIYNNFVYDLQLYNRLILLSDIVLYLKGDLSALHSNHSKMLEYCQLYLDNKFRATMNYIMNKDTNGIDCIDNYNNNLNNLLENSPLKDLLIECRIEDVKNLTQN